MKKLVNRALFDEQFNNRFIYKNVCFLDTCSSSQIFFVNDLKIKPSK